MRNRRHPLLPTCCLASFALLLGLGAPASAESDETEVSGVEIFGPPPPSAPDVISRDETGRATLRATRLEEPLVVDGRLDDAVYARVPAMTGFVQQEPNEGEPATEETEAWIFYDDRNFYVAARCWDSHPERMVANEMRRDHFNIFQNENFTLVLDTFYDRRNGFYFMTNPLGAIRDQAVADEGNANNVDWNTVWNVQARTFEQGWTLEIAIPFKSLRYRAGREQVWGINMRRLVRWKNEQSFITPISRSYGNRGIYRFSDAATLVGVEAPVNSRNFEVKPYGLTSLTTNANAEPPVSNDFGGDAGVDVKYGLTRGLIADVTYNTDFAQIEEDQQQVNLTRFSLFFPEKRDFFLEGQGIFAFGGVEQRGGGGPSRRGNDSNDLTPIMFFSRRIGLTEEGVDPIRVGGRVTGRAGKVRIGALDIQTEGVGNLGIPATNFSVLRLRRDILRRSDVGVIATHRNSSLTEGGATNSLFGLDANFAFYQNLRANAYYAVTRTSLLETGTVEGDASSYTASLDYSADRYGLLLERLKVGESFKPELGFVRREAFVRDFVQGRFSPRPYSIQAIRRFVFEGELDYIEGASSGQVETRRFQGAFRTEFDNSDQATVEYTHNYEFLPEPFEIAEGIVLPVGGYRFHDVRLSYQLGGQRKVPGTASIRTGSFFDGDRTEASYDGRIEVSPRFSLEPRVSLNWVDLVEGSFTATLLATRINFTFTPRTFVSSLIQYNSSSNSFTSSLRLRWEYEPGSDLFVVYSEGREGLDASPYLANRSFAVKFTKLFRF